MVRGPLRCFSIAGVVALAVTFIVTGFSCFGSHVDARSPVELRPGGHSSGSSDSSSVFDGNLATVWASTRSTNQAPFFSVRLRAATEIGEIRWVFGSQGGAGRFEIEGWTGGSTWTRIASGEPGRAGESGWVSVEITVSAIRFVFANPDEASWIGGIDEIEVWPGRLRSADGAAATPADTRTASPVDAATNASTSVASPVPADAATTPLQVGSPVAAVTATPASATSTMAAATPTAEPVDGVLIANGSFENGTSRWYAKYGAAATTDRSHGGAGSLMVGPGGFASQGVQLGVGSTYVLSAWGMIGGGTTPGQVGISYLDSSGVRREALQPVAITFSGDAFTLGSIEFTVPDGIETFNVYIWKPEIAGLFYVDDLRLERKNDHVDDVAPRPSAGCRQILFPSYSDPRLGVWSTAATTGPALGVMILNVSNGVGPKRKSMYDAPLAQARARGVLVAGYILTGYGERSYARIKAEMDLYYQWYGVRSFFFDEGDVALDSLPLYGKLAAATHANGGVVIVNFGWAPNEAFMNFVDIAIIYESPSHDFLSDAYKPPEWVDNYPAYRIAQMIHTTPETSLDAVLAKSKASNAGFVWITDRSGSNGESAYMTLPPYWNRLNQTLVSGCSAGMSASP